MRISIENIAKLLNANRIGNHETEIDWMLLKSLRLGNS